MAVERLPFELAKPSNDTFVTKTSEIGHNGEPLDQALGDLSKLDNISKQSTQSEEQAIIYETDGGVQVGKIDPNGADFTNLKRGGQQVARMSDLPTKDSSIGENPSTTNVPTTKAVKDYVDANSGGDYPIETESTSSDTEEQVWGNDAGTQEYVKIGSYGMKSKAYLDMNGNNVIPTKDASIGETPSQTNVPTSKAVADYVDAHSGTSDLPIDKSATESEDEEIIISNNAKTENYAKVGSYGIKAKGYFDLNGNRISSAMSKINNLPCQLDKEELRILDIGNSFTSDPNALLPNLLAETTINVNKVAMYKCVRGGASFKTWYDCYHDNDNQEYAVNKTFGDLSVSITGTAAANNGARFRSALQDTKWDVIIIHQVSTYSGSYADWEGTGEGGYLKELMRLIRINQPQACIYFSLVHSTMTDAQTKWTNIAASAMKMAENYGAFIIPYGTAIQNLRQTTYNNAVDLTRDGTHLGYGLARYTAACAYFETIFAPRIKQSVYGNAARYTCTSDEQQATYPQSSIDVTNDNASVAQLAAVLACADMYNVYNPQNTTL